MHYDYKRQVMILDDETSELSVSQLFQIARQADLLDSISYIQEAYSERGEDCSYEVTTLIELGEKLRDRIIAESPNEMNLADDIIKEYESEHKGQNSKNKTEKDLPDI